MAQVASEVSSRGQKRRLGSRTTSRTRRRDMSECRTESGRTDWSLTNGLGLSVSR